MKKILRRGEKLNNKGVTLIELMVAIAILSVAIIPLMYAFVNSMKYNAKGRELQQTTVLAHTIMEKCKGLTVDEIYDRMLDHTFLETQTAAADTNSTKVPMTNASTTWGLGSGGEQTYFIGGVQLENTTYDVQVTIDKHSREDLYNGTLEAYSDMLYTESMNKYNDAVFTVNTLNGNTGDEDRYSVAGLDFEAYNAAFQMIADGLKADAETKPDINEEVNVPLSYIMLGVGNHLEVYRYITIDATGSSGHDVVNVTYTYTFRLDNGTYTYNYQPPSGGATIPLSVDLGTAEIPLYNTTFMIYDNAATMSNGATLENIYFFYYPAYSGNHGGFTEYPIARDEIVINNNTGRSVKLYMVKQKNPAYTDVELNTLEAHYYNPNIFVNGDVVFYHNLAENIGGTSPVTPPHLISTGSVTLMADLYYRNLKTLMYNVEVTIYPAGSYNGSYIISGSQPIITLDGTILDW